MEAQATGNKLHPVLWAAAVAVIVLSAAGVAAIFGVIPTVGSSSKQAESITAAEPAPTSAAAPAVPAKPAEQASPAPARKVATAKPAVSRPAQKTAAQPAQVAAKPAPAPAVCINCGTIESVVEKTQKGQGTGIGAVAGGVAGAVLGSQIGKGSGKTAATVLGAAGGAVAGHQTERYVRRTAKWEIIVRMDDGTAREFDLSTQPVWRAGDKVKVENNIIMAR
ncbi:MAG: glycine zipper 2TM domain-containing protein [Rhodocyclaceae bacterium]|jgi:outer membrane lipoprotein SlyB